MKPQTIINCFRKTGALPQNRESEDPFADLEDDDTCLEELVHQFDPDTTANEYVNASTLYHSKELGFIEVTQNT